MRGRWYRATRRGLSVLLTLVLVVALPLSWENSGLVRVSVYMLVYPAASAEQRRAILRRLRDREGEAALAWELRLSYGEADEQAAAWSELQELIIARELTLPPNLEGLVIATAIDAASPSRDEALSIAAASRLREPGLAPMIIVRLGDPAGSEPWLGEALGFVGGDPEAARRALDGALDRLDRARQRFEGQRASLQAGVGDLDALAVQGAVFLLRGYAGLGPAARASVEKIRRWRGCRMAAVEDAAALALWRCGGEADAQGHLRRRFEASPRGSADELECARNLVLAGEGAGACRRLTEDRRRIHRGRRLIESLERLFERGLVSGPVLEELAAGGDERVAGAARGILARLDRTRESRAP